MESKDQSWREVDEIPAEFTSETMRALLRVDEFKDRWIEFVEHASDEDMLRRRERTLRRHAIETGILERLYDVDWGVTEALVAEGLSLDAAEREGGIAPDTLETIRAQLDALQFLVAFVNSEQILSVHFVRSLHAAITATQSTYDAIDQFGNSVNATLEHGQWKSGPNHVRRPDGTFLEYTPPIFVDDHMSLLVELYEQYEGKVHPVALAAWLHHRFICVHPFSDGNGRVARALTLVSLLRGGFTPLVVQRQTREEYIEALDRANDNDLEPLIRLFARLEEYALRSELETPALDLAGSAVDVARAYAQRLQKQLKATDAERKKLIAQLAFGINQKVTEMLKNTGKELETTYRTIDKGAKVSLKISDRPPSGSSKYWSVQIYRSAKEVDFYSNISEGSWWTSLTIVVFGAAMRFVAVLQKVGRGETGVLALTVFAESFDATKSPQSDKALPKPLIRLSPSDSVNILHSDSVEDVWPSVHDVVNRTLSAAINEFSQTLG